MQEFAAGAGEHGIILISLGTNAEFSEAHALHSSPWRIEPGSFAKELPSVIRACMLVQQMLSCCLSTFNAQGAIWCIMTCIHRWNAPEMPLKALLWVQVRGKSLLWEGPLLACHSESSGSWAPRRLPKQAAWQR